MSSPTELASFIQGVFESHGLDLRGYKPTTLERRVRKRMAQLGLTDYTEYAELLQAKPEETVALMNTILINVTEFFRDPQAWEALRTGALPRLLNRLRPGDVLRCWSAGCASGEEPYSLAIMLAEVLGKRLGEIDIKIYATDIDEEALKIARRGEYSAEQLNRVPTELRNRYFTGPGPYRIQRDLRRMLIFGGSNILLHAPISHCELIICRNMLIYFDSAAQEQIVSKLHYALDPGGLLFLGGSESKLTDSKLFDTVNARWRIFQKQGAPGSGEADWQSEHLKGDSMPNGAEERRIRQELERLRLHQRYLLETLKSSVLVLDGDSVITSGNDATHAVWGVAPSRLIGKPLAGSEIAKLCPELPERMGIAAAAQPRVEGSPTVVLRPVELQTRIFVGAEERIITVLVRPITGENGEWNGSLIYAEDMTYRKRLQQTVHQLEYTSGELQSANEELETTNEELQSTNEELETTNEELQSTNEELETTNEELQAVNEELETMNEELEHRTRELNDVSSRFAETLQRMPWPLLMIDREEQVQIWNAAAQALLGVHPTMLARLRMDRLPIEPGVLQALQKSVREVCRDREPVVLQQQTFLHSLEESSHVFDVHFTPVVQTGNEFEGVLIMFGPAEAQPPFSAGKGGAS